MISKLSVSLPLLAGVLATMIATFAQCGDDATKDQPPAQPAQDPRPNGRPVPRNPAPAAVIPAHVPRVRMLISGSMLSRLEPCGCASGQFGGLPRRMQHIGEQRTYDLLIEGGNLVAGATELDLQKALTAVSVLFDMQRPYDVLGIGQNDLLLPYAEWSAFLATRPIVATDLTGPADWPGVLFVEKAVAAQKVRVMSFTMQLPPPLLAKDATVKLLAPADAWQRGLTGADPATLRVLLVHDTDTRTRELVPSLTPPPDLVLCFDQGYTEAPPRPEMVGTVAIVYPGIRGRILLDLTLARLPEGPRVGYDLLPLAGSKTVPGGGGDPDVKLVLLRHREQVKQDNVLARMARQKPTANGSTYVGTATCAGCHASAFASWQASRHGRAWQTLVDAEADPKRYGWPVTAYPDCVSCHVVGYGEASGFVTGDDTPLLANVGCESCHGAGSAHAQSNGSVILGKVGGGTPSVTCTNCHDFEQSPDFLYTKEWPKIEHGLEPHQGKGKK